MQNPSHETETDFEKTEWGEKTRATQLLSLPPRWRSSLFFLTFDLLPSSSKTKKQARLSSSSLGGRKKALLATSLLLLLVVLLLGPLVASAQRVNGPVNGGGGAAADLAKGKEAAKKADPDAPMTDQPLASQKPNRPPPPPPAKEIDEGSEEDDVSEKKKKKNSDEEQEDNNGAAPLPKNATTAGGNSTTTSNGGGGKAPLRSDTNDFKFPVSWPTANIKHSLVKYWDGNVNLTGYLAYNTATLEKRPCVVIVPGSSGIGNFERWRADMLAANGYVAFVADLYGNKVKQGPAMPVKTRAELVKAYVTNEGLMKGKSFLFFEKRREREGRERREEKALCFFAH